MIRALLLGVCVWGVGAGAALAQEAPAQAPAFLAVVEGNATLEREGEVVPAEPNMPFVTGDRLRTLDGRVQIVFPDGTAIEVAENSEVECISPTRVRLLAGTMDHVQRAIGGSQSATHLPPELDVYGGTFDQYGSWQYDAPYGYVWYPTVAADWRPYHYGYWSSVPRYGYTWIGVDVFAWPTHHYGRWGFARNRWFWIPGRTWGPAWVSWASAPGYVSWCPLGFDSRPVFAFSYGFGRSFAGWTILPRNNFGTHRYYAHRNWVDPRRIPANAAFVARNGPPVSAARVGRVNSNGAPTVGVAVPRYPGNQPPPAGRQSPVAGRQSPVGSPVSPAGTPQSPGGSLQSQAGRRQAPVGTQVAPSDARPGNSLGGTPTVVRPGPYDGRQPTLGGPPTVVRPGPYDGRQPTLGDRRIAPRPDGQVQMHYGMPRETTPAGSPAQAPAMGRPTLTPDNRATSPAYQPAAPGYRSPGEYRIQRMDPRIAPSAPSAPQGPPPGAPPARANSPYGERAHAPVAVPRMTPTPTPAAQPPQAAPAQAAPQGRPAPANAAPQGEGRPRAGGRGRSR